MILNRSLPADGNISFMIYTAPAVEPISVEEVKLFARIDGDDEDSLLSQFIVAARVAAENYLGRALITQTIRASVDFWPESGLLELPRPPLQSITQIATRDEDDVLTVYSDEYYYSVTEALPGYVKIKKGITPPENTDRENAGIIIDYVAGYGDRAEDVPEPIRQALMLWTSVIYESRVVASDPPPEARAMLDLFRVERA